MPQKTFYLRVEDEDLWKGIEDKAQFIHDALHSTDINKYIVAVRERKEIKKIMKPFLENMKKTTVISSSDVPMTKENPGQLKEVAVCKIHGIPLDARGRCLQKGCKYA